MLSYGDWMRTAPGAFLLAAIVATGVAAGGAITVAHSAASAAPSGTGTVGPRADATTSGTTRTPAAPPLSAVADETHPSVLPRSGRARTRFAATLTLADAPGHSGVLAVDYRLQLQPPPGRRPQRCAPTQPPNIDSGSARQVVRVALTTPERGWCAGRYRLTIFLQRGPYCPAPSPGQQPPPCPEFATQELDVGHASFVVTSQH